MIPFQAITPADRQWIQPILRKAGTQNADFSFVNLYAWGPAYHLEAAEVCGGLVTKTRTAAGVRYSYPEGTDAPEKAVEAILEDAAGRGIDPVLSGVSPAQAALLGSICPGAALPRPCPERYDYLYRADKLATLAGKRLHGKRNHIHRFQTQFPHWCAVPVSAENLPQCRSIAAKWRQESPERQGGDYDREAVALALCLAHYEALGLEGCLITVGGVPAAFAMGSLLREDTVDVHFEKALEAYPGAYAVVNRSFAAQLITAHPRLEWLNREDDMGLENLRTAKQSYCPDAMVEKLEVTLTQKKMKKIC